ncbi:hypothetical protein Anas_12123, partial [Armadillidium nasatum]
IGVCYFPLEYQGIFSTQAGVSGEKSHKYLQITILPDAIPVWGVCHEMNGPLVILRDSTGGEECFRCFHVTLQSPNVFQIFTEGIDKCYIKSKSAKTSCPTTAEIKNKIAREIMLYTSVQYNYFSNSQICSDDVFIGQIWNTQGRILDSDRKNCLVIGEYTGVLPDNPSLCAKLATDCRNPSMKYFTVYSCENSSQIFENIGVT